MDVVILFLIVVAELAAMLGVVAFILNRKNNKLQDIIYALSTTSTPPASDSFESIASGYLPYLEKTILESRTQIETAGKEAEPDNASVEAIGYRLSVLEAEKKFIEHCNDYPENHWQHVSEFFVPPETPGPENQVGNESLEKFRDHFFSMKKQLSALTESKQKLTEQLEALIPENERSDELRALVETLNAQRDRLQDELSQLESQSDELAKGAADTSTQAEAQNAIQDDENATKLLEQIKQQKQKISELEHLIDDLRVQEENAKELQAKVDQFDLANRDMDMCIKVLEEENEFLQDQIKALLELDTGETVYHSEDHASEVRMEMQKKLDDMQTTLGEKDQQLNALQEKYTSMEHEYLTLYEESNANS